MLIERIFKAKKSIELNPCSDDKLKAIRIVEGYFQNIYWINPVIEQIRMKLEEVPKSLNFRNFIKIDKPKILGIHVRRGDYLNHKDSFGVLDVKYYLACVSRLELDSFDRVLIFSDDIEWCRNNLQIDDKVEFVSSNEIVSVIETHALLGKCDTLICSNSTFSISAAVIYAVPHVIIPKQLYFNSKVEEELSISFPLHWKKVPARWEVL